MTFAVEPAEILAYRTRLRDLYDDAAWAKNYVHTHGDFGFHEAGIIGTLAGQHGSFLGQLDELHNRLLVILRGSQEALTALAETYLETDEAAAARIDSTYPPSPRRAPSRD